MAEQAQFVNVLRNVGEQMAGLSRTVGENMAGLSTTVGAQGVAKIINPFDGNPKDFKEWIKSIEKYALLTRVQADQVKMVAYQASKGPVSDFIKRYLEANAACTWDQVKTELTTRFAEVTDTQHALMLLRKVKQKQGESIQVYAERLMALGDEAFPHQVHAAIDQQLIGFFIDGLLHDYMKMKVMRDNPATLQQAITIATGEQNLRRRFDLRSNHSSRSLYGNNLGEEPMEVDHARPSFRCYKCNKQGHKAKECWSKNTNINAVNNSVNPARQKSRANITCWFCQKRGHYANECRAKAALKGVGSHPGQVTCNKQGN